MNVYQTRAPILYQLAQFITTDDKAFDEDCLYQARRVVADTIGAAYSGIKTDAFQIAYAKRDVLFGAGDHEIWGMAERGNLMAAIFYNSLAISATDFDEGHRYAVGHPASTVVPVAMTLGRHLNKTYAEMLQAIVVGYEAASRFSGSRIKSKITSYSSGRWGAIGSAATAAVLLGLSTEQCIHALSNAAVLAPTMLGGSTDVKTGSMSKEGVAWACQAGCQSAFLAQNGFVGPWLFVDEHGDYNRPDLVKNLGKTWLISSNYFKPYACCRWLHAAIYAAELIKQEWDFQPSDISRIKIGIFQRAIDLVGDRYPLNSVQAQFHLPFTIASILNNKSLSPLDFSDNNLNDPTILKLIDLSELHKDMRYEALFPAQLAASVSVQLKDGSIRTKEVMNTPWDAGAHPSDEALKAKFMMQVDGDASALWDSLMSIK